MPVYSFECPKCLHKEEKLIKIADYSPTGHKCPKCEDMELTRDLQADMCSFSKKGLPSTSILQYHGVTNPATGEGLKPFKR